MGGHGGLNILPQKSWNVYGQRNRLRVAEDEAEQARKDAEQQRKRHKRDNEARLKDLRRAQGQDVEARQDVDQGQHVNFWADFEEEGHNPEALEEAKADARKRGNAKTQTSDARFDASFEVMHGLKGPAPWYARPPTQLASDGGDMRREDSCSMHAEGLRDKQSNGSPATGVSSPNTKHGKPEKEAKRTDRHGRRKESSLLSKVDIAKLREERLAREKAESARSRSLLRRNMT
eukprot:TRINITY_DN12731_c0_g1_i2.p1 TRINITY_DN12731_c0_g1~~TRINITY_DN12731_c0_g1_i2.p1  ORF type:complete len:233 (-),score=31.08 TRINITY_DN12731_c0_g1_i2:146-844(-)